tara:strand:- start:24574 stop:24936 length:363 start_codon:yes stop_codon:yes gene_type:complete
MKFILLVYATPDAWSEEGRQQATQESVQICQELNQTGNYLVAAPLHPVSTSVCVRVREGTKLVTKGPFAETTEHLGGFFLVDVENQEAAIEIAGRIPGARAGTVEVRPVVELSDLPDAHC